MLPRKWLSLALVFSSSLTPAPMLWGQDDEAPSAKFALTLKPVQGNVDYELPSAADIEKCTVEGVDETDGKGWVVLGVDGRRLRRFLDTNRDGDTDLWCYFQDGVEVYRDIDANFDGKADQYRWLGTAGIRWGLDENQDGKIESWKTLSAEEATAELVAAIGAVDSNRFERLLVTPDELKSLGATEKLVQELGDKRRRALRDFERFAKEQKAITPESRWQHFAASMPGTVPAGAAGNTRDWMVYENAVAMFTTNNKNEQLVVGTIVRNGDAWRLIDLPQLASSDAALADNTGFFFSGATIAMSGARSGGAPGEDLQQLITSLEQIDTALRKATGPQAATLHDQRAQALEKIIAASDPAQRSSWVRQLVDTVAAAIQDGSFPEGLTRLNSLSQTLGKTNDPLKSYVDFQIISSEYSMKLTGVTAQKDLATVQDWYVKNLERFANEHASAPEAAQAMLQLGLSKEFEDDEKAAIVWYSKVANQFRTSDAGKKAAGAVRRLESVGRPLALVAKTIDNRDFDLAKLRGKPVIIQYWATWCEPCKQDMKLLRQLQARYQRAGLQIVAINVDGTRDDAVRFINEAKLPWVTLFEEGGLESSPLANLLGVQTLPTMLLIDKEGKVVRHNITASQLDSELETLTR